MLLPIRLRMTAWYVTLLALIVAAVGAFLVLQLRNDLTAALDHRLGSAADQIALGYHAEGPPEARDVSSTVLSGERAASQVLDPAGRVITSYGDPVARAALLDARARVRALGGDPLRQTTSPRGADARFRLSARASSWRGRPAVVVAADSTAGVERSVHRLLVLLLIAGPAALVATAAGGWWLAGRSLRPIDRLRAQAQDLGVDHLERRLAVPRTGDEVARLATTLNTMLGRIEHGVEEQHRLVADASHELRSPLAAMRAELDVSLRTDELGDDARAVLESLRDEVDRMSRTVDDLLTLASADEGRLDLVVEPVDLADLAVTVARALRPLGRSRGVTVDADADVDGDPALALADERRLQQALGNLVDNAVKHSPDGGAVLVRTRVVDGEAVVSVDDEGPGIPAALRERVFDRFFRLDASRTRATGGSGIGLSLVREIARALGGRVWVEPRAGGGSRFSLAVPALRGHDHREGGEHQGGPAHDDGDQRTPDERLHLEL